MVFMKIKVCTVVDKATRMQEVTCPSLTDKILCFESIRDHKVEKLQ